MKTLLSSLLTALFLLPLWAGQVAAAQSESTLDKINRTGVIIVGHRESSVPFSYYDSAQNVIGHAQDYSNAIVEAIRKKLDRQDLVVKMVPITSQNRIPLLQNGTYDFECGSTTNNTERQQQVSFSNSFFIVGTRLLTHKDSGISGFDDIRGKNVSVTAGTTSEKLLFIMNDREKLGVRIISSPNHDDSFRALESGRAHAFFLDDVLMAGERSRSRVPTDWVMVGEPQSYEAYGCMLRKGDEAFKALLDETIAAYQTSGQAETSYRKWFMNPIPPRGANMFFELPEAMKALYKSPNDKAYQ